MTVRRGALLRSLNARVALSAAVVLIIFLALSAFALERAFRDSARSVRQERLTAQVYLLMAAAEVAADGSLTLANGPPDPRLDMPASGLYASIVDAQGRAVWRSKSALSASPPLAPQLAPGEQRFELSQNPEGSTFFVNAFGVSWSTAGASYRFTFSVAEDMAAFEHQIGVYRRTLLTWLGAMSALLIAAQWITLRWGLRPLRRVADELERLEQGVQDAITGHYPTEVSRLTDNLNRLIAHERARQQRYRDAMADLAHSLKTPLAVLGGELSSASAAQDSALAREQVDRMSRIVSYHLQRAAASGKRALAAPVALRPAVERVLGALAKVHADKQVHTALEIEPAVRFAGDEGDLMELLGNLLDNAFKWCVETVRVRAGMEESRLRLTIEDDGPGIAAADAQRVLERGVRADEEVPGHGIGLAVVRDVVAAYGGQIEIGSSPLGGAAVTITLPGLA
jgi:two-component system sensor histidine kinase PhoQ